MEPKQGLNILQLGPHVSGFLDKHQTVNVTTAGACLDHIETSCNKPAITSMLSLTGFSQMNQIFTEIYNFLK